MKIDIFTKLILTGIFGCLCILILRDISWETTAVAQDDIVSKPMEVIIVGCTNGTNGPAGAVPVTVTGCTSGVKGRAMPLPISIRNTSGNLPVEINDLRGNLPVEIRGPRQIPVSVQNWPR